MSVSKYQNILISNYYAIQYLYVTGEETEAQTIQDLHKIMSSKWDTGIKLTIAWLQNPCKDIR